MNKIPNNYRLRRAVAIGLAALVLTLPLLATQVVLQNPTATLSQDNIWNASFITDGDTSDYAGWAIYNFALGGTFAQTAVVETATDIGSTSGSLLMFKLYHVNHNPNCSLGRFRLSYTTDSRATFADGLNSGGDVTANWVVLTPQAAVATGGAVLTPQADNSILASSSNPNTTVYTVTAEVFAQGITGFRLEALEDASLPTSGPGRASNGNFVLTELTVDIFPVGQVILQNPTATLSQAGLWNANNYIIDGDTSDYAGWAIYDFALGGTFSQTAVVETATDVGFSSGSLLTFKLYHVNHNPNCSLGRFRLSYTTDSRATFADGLNSGGDVTANWIVITPQSALASGGAVLTVQADGSILASGSDPATTIYTVTAGLLVQGITGFRLEALEDASLPTSGPGRASNGNFVLTEFAVSIFADSDQDQLPDWWEYMHFQGLTATAAGDPDADVLNNLGEYLAGTNPNVADIGYIPNNKNGQIWPATVPIAPPAIGAPTQEREYTFNFIGLTSVRPNDGVARAIVERIDNVLVTALATRANWAAYAALQPFPAGPTEDVHNIPNPTANANYARQYAWPTHTAFMDIYFDTSDNLCLSHTAEYRLRRRFDNVERWYNHINGDPSPVDPDLNNRIEFMSKVDRIFDPFKPGYSEVTESRNRDTIPNLPAASIQGRINDFQDGRWPADLQVFGSAPPVTSADAGKVCNAAWKLREYLLRTAPGLLTTDVLKLRPKVALLAERRRQHLRLPGLNLSFVPGVPLINVFIISVDTVHVYEEGPMLAYMKGETGVFPQSVGSFVQLDVEFERDTSDKLDDLINAIPQRPDYNSLVALKAAFLQDQSTVINLIAAEFNGKPHDLTEFYSIKAALEPLSTHAQISGTGVSRDEVQGIIGGGLSFNGGGYVSYVAQAQSTTPTVYVDPASPFVLTEFQTRGTDAEAATNPGDNRDAIQDENGSKNDWIEIQNVSGTVQNLNGWYLTDNAASPTKWAIPNGVSVPAGGSIIVFADDSTLAASQADTTPPLHATFVINGSGEYLALRRPDGLGLGGTILATEYSIAAGFIPDFEYDVSYGIVWNGSQWVEGFFNASPGETNEGIHRRRPMQLGNDDFTISLWLKTTSTGVAILSKSDANGTLDTGEKQMYLDGSGKVRYVGAGAAGSIVGTTAVNNGAWHHVAITFVASTGIKKVYVDGQDNTDAAASNYTSTPDSTAVGAQLLLLGYDTSAQATGNFNGILDEVAVWGRALSATDIAAIRTAGLQGSGVNTRGQIPNGLLFHASMDMVLAPQPATKYEQAIALLP